ncbi:serine decarboxylase 2-like isoform X2 [Dendronephthya gigantea]|uniref:serine decarboxylase 2-like isoform X2 n=1 Tax=Dendronephthya gigantea TaxID=151771 RepID=UPI00106953B6|nr:serine decarboxylase 2-like isoform X2 [Dendronephthya gigantea]
MNNSEVHRDYRPNVNIEDVRLSEHGVSLNKRRIAWNKLHRDLTSHQRGYLGFQANQNLDCDRIKPFFDMAINNFGDPFSASGLNGTNTIVMERAVLEYFAKLWGIIRPSQPSNGDKLWRTRQSYPSNEEERAYWGYVTTMGCTEDISGESGTEINETYRTLVPNHVPSADVCTKRNLAANPNNFTPVVFISEESYHGNLKALHMLQMKTFREIGSGHFPCPLEFPYDYPTCFNGENLDKNGWPRAVPVDEVGAMNIPCLVKLVTPFLFRGYPPLIVFTSGTTFRGAYDNPKAAIDKLVPILKEHNMYERPVQSSVSPTKFDVRSGFWFHIDGASGGGQLAFLEMAMNQGLVEDSFPDGFPLFDFRIPEVKSIATSLHKWFGCPFPAALFMMRKMDQVKPFENPSFIGGNDSTVSGSRNGHSVLVLWDLLSRKSYNDLVEIVVREEAMVTFSLGKFRDLERDLKLDLWLLHSPGSLFILFKQPRQDIVRRYSLASKALNVKTPDGEFERRIYSRICLMPHVTADLILQLIEELRTPSAFPNQQ